MRRYMALTKRSAAMLPRGSDFFQGITLLMTLHGATEAVVPSICSFGAKDLRRTDPGFAGAGIYTTFQAEYAAAYSGMTDSSVMVLCCCAAGNIYPISRSSDY